MKVHELITALQTMPPNDEVRLWDDGRGTAYPSTSVAHESAHGEHYVVID